MLALMSGTDFAPFSGVTETVVLETPVLIGYARISKVDGSQSLDLQRDALRQAGVSDDAIYEDQASGQREDRPGLAAFFKAARQGDVIVVWKGPFRPGKPGPTPLFPS